jgi:GPH family glycoside/pentoside/hexuronide:cation symporter
MTVRSRLTLPVQVGYATAELGINTVETLLRIYLLIYYTNVVGLEAGLGGLAVFLALAWDAVTDPLMGMISDRTRHRFGGRRGYLPIGGLLMAVGTMALFWPPDLAGQAGKFAWFLGSYCFLNTGMTVLSVPYMAMAGEMTEDPHHRAVLFGWRFVFANLGAMCAAILPLLFLGDGGGESNGSGNAATMPQVSAIATAMVVLSALVSWLATKRVEFQSKPARHESILRSFTLPLRNPTFRPLLAAYVVATTGIGINATTFLYFYKYHLRLPEQATQQVLTVFLLVFTLSILFWVQLAKRHGKRRPLVVAATVLAIGNTALYLLLPVGLASFWWVMIFGAVGLGAFVGSIVLFDTMLTDVLDHDQVCTGEVRSGLFFGVWRFASKLARGGSVLVVGVVLWAVDFQEQQEVQPDGVESALVWLFGPGVGAFFLLSACILWRYRFVEKKQEQVRRILASRGANQSEA